MKALTLLAAASAASLALLTASPMAAAQAPARGGGAGGSFQGAPPSGGSFRGAPAWRGGPVHGAPRPRTNVHVGIHGPGVWWGPGVWRGGWWGPPPGVWSTTWWGPGVWPGVWWGPGVWPGSWAGPGVWAGPWGGAGVWVPGGLPATAVAPAPVYVERSPPAEPPAPVWWYWCAEAKAYYPYVKECPGGWQRVPPQAVPAAENQ